MNETVITITITHNEANAPITTSVEGKRLSTADLLLATTRLLEITQEKTLKDTGSGLSDVIATLLINMAQSDDAEITDDDGTQP